MRAFGALFGAVVGIALGIFAAWALGEYSAWQNPKDPSARSVMIVGMATIPGGLVLGAIIGAVIFGNTTNKP